MLLWEISFKVKRRISALLQTVVGKVNEAQNLVCIVGCKQNVQAGTIEK